MATKKDLIDRLSKSNNSLNPKDVKFAIDCVMNMVTDSLMNGDRIEIRGFGSISIRKRHYPQSDKTYKMVYYRMSKNIQQSLN